jgi:hypothetical protein
MDAHRCFQTVEYVQHVPEPACAIQLSGHTLRPSSRACKNCLVRIFTPVFRRNLCSSLFCRSLAVRTLLDIHVTTIRSLTAWVLGTTYLLCTYPDTTISTYIADPIPGSLKPHHSIVCTVHLMHLVDHIPHQYLTDYTLIESGYVSNTFLAPRAFIYRV